MKIPYRGSSACFFPPKVGKNQLSWNLHQERLREKNQYIWTGIWKGKPKQWTRKTAYSRIMEVMESAKLNGIAATPKGLRHGFAIACLDRNIPLTLVQKWMGHTSITTTAIYANASGEEERNIAARLWR